MLDSPLPPCGRLGHVGHVKRCLAGLPGSQVELDASTMAVVFYCIGTLDLLGMLQEKTSETDRQSWRDWVWEQQTHRPNGSGFRPSTYMTPQRPPNVQEDCTNYDGPHVIMSYTALLSLAILRDDFTQLDRPGLIKFLKSCQRDDGSLLGVIITPWISSSAAYPISYLTNIYPMLDDWSGINVDLALQFVAKCRTYEGGYGQSPNCEAQGGTTYISIASLYLAPGSPSTRLTPAEREKTIQWLVQNQLSSGGFTGRTNKDADACYCFWCGAALQILGARELVNMRGLGQFLSSCQFKYGGIAKTPGEHPDPYHTYLSLAALSMYPPDVDSTWAFEPLDPLLNARVETSNWARAHIPAR
ncbi:terpenoid cyclases/protein prenyltransferase alpha-alpha toroid [Armillaria mellea]|nr:terpenoid cyclases/protein prenyltransferase alpha-alpha toroid [Armillaria mellea]